MATPPSPGFYDTAPEHEYPMLHQSIASVLVSRSPLHGWHAAFGPKDEEQPEPTKAQRRGDLCHALLLGGKKVQAVAADDWRTKAAREKKATARAEGKIPCLYRELDDVLPLVKRVREDLKQRGIELTGKSELTMIWQSPGGVWCQGRMDHFIEKKRLIVDLKFVRNANPEAVARSMVDYGYHIQAAAYTQGVETLKPELAGRLTFLFVFVESEPPNAITVGEPSGDMRKLGESQWGLACDLWRENLETCGTKTPWPGYPTGIQRLEPPPWALAKELERFEIMDRQESNVA